MTTRTDAHLVPLPVPAALDAPDAWVLHGMVDATNASALDAWGDLDLARVPTEILAGLQHQEYDLKLRFVALDAPLADGPADPARVLGYVAVNLPRQDNTHTGFVQLDVRPEHRGRGIGSALHDLALATAREHGRTMLTTSTDHGVEPPEGPGTLVPSTGTGRVATDHPGVAFATRRGWDLEQVSRRSVLDVPLEPAFLAAHAEAAAQAAGPDYRVITWDGRCPDAWVDQFAHLNTRMSTDAPAGGIDLREDVWDADRVRAAEQTFVERGMAYRVAAAVHEPTGTLAAFTALVNRPDTVEFVHQDDTLVLREHRGHRLGMLVKTANLARLTQIQPGTRRIGTWNAQENAPMLAINVALGFRPAGVAGEWQLRLG
ncbi:GNAT family N-acetyltransferase [Cellulomonas triticagri]|uniref:GNAT family N-acetyltransferase n=1 Tax=Cellulomonas triticagri TaxID=2483352 RepID=A0A3M2JM60_9CELL|nr:GNAT family N-acetyltransferase [Cellulomonas triticagri]RMI13331.1 GNAT family N-acetyltransferase [Cellulomonas triticagri]